jgi:hypothetical protein
MNPIAATLSIRYATLEARRRTAGDDRIGTSAQCGYFRAVRVTHKPSGASVVEPLTGWTNAAKVIEFLNAI